MKVVSDTSPLCYLAWIEKLDLLPLLYQEIVIPPAVLTELTDAGAPPLVRESFRGALSWLQIQPVERERDVGLATLHPGEQQALLLAEEVGADLLLLDDRDARHVAKTRGLPFTGLLGVLGEAADRRLLDLPRVVDKLRATSFRATPALLKSLLDRYE